MKKVILLLLAILPLISSCQKQKTISDVKGTIWNHNIYSGDGLVSLKYMLYLDNNGTGKYEVYNMNLTNEKLIEVCTVNYEQKANVIKLKFTDPSNKYMTVYYNLKDNKLKYFQPDEDTNSSINIPSEFAYIDKY